MSCIRILPEDISNRIAAGEVIERPASVVKELVENSLDAGSSKITVHIEKAGIKLIAVSDDGCGMDSDDALLCLEPHATSKIHHIEDINRIYTLGFRGEALPSIASVARVRLRTRRKTDPQGAEVVVEGGKFTCSGPAGCAPGTEVLVRDLFFNTPARKKFMRSDSTEERHIQEVLYSLSLAFPRVSFELVMDGKNIFSSPADNESLLSRIRTFFGKAVSENLIWTENCGNEISLSGYLAKHGFTKNSRRDQRIYVNNRPVESPAAYAAIKEGYGSLAAEGKYPPVILFLKMDPARADVNVHPAKREVRFRESNAIRAVISESIRSALRNSQAPTVSVSGQLSLRSILHNSAVSYTPGVKTLPSLEIFKETDSPPSVRSGAEENRPPADGRPLPADSKPPGNAESTPASSLKIVSILDDTYILASSENGLVVIDQHAAHERVIFEKILGSSRSKNSLSQKLLIPVSIELSRAEILFLEKNMPAFASLGFEMESFGANTVLLSSIPAGLPQDNVRGMFSSLLSSLTEERNTPPRVDEAGIAAAACKLAVKSHDKLTLKEAEMLLRQMAACELPFSCPHGRPTMINISYGELEKRFGRRK